MTQENNTNKTDDKQTLEDKTRLYERAKYAAPGIVATAVGGFGPEIKDKYDSLNNGTKDTVSKYVKIGAGMLAGAAIAYLFQKK